MDVRNNWTDRVCMCNTRVQSGKQMFRKGKATEEEKWTLRIHHFIAIKNARDILYN